MFNFWKKRSRLGVAKIMVAMFLLVALIFSFYFWRLGSLTAGLGPTEVNARASSLSLQAIADNPIYAPHKILQYGAQKTFGRSALPLRSVSAVLAIIFILCFYQLVRGWFGKMIGFFATLLFATTPWLVLLARSAQPEILLLAPVAVLASYYWLMRSGRQSACLALMVSSGLIIYLPGGILLVLLGLIFARKDLKKAAKNLSLKWKIIGTFLLLIILSPMIYAGIRNPSALKPLLLIPAQWSPLGASAKALGWDFLALFWRAPLHVDFIIGRLPMHSGAQITLALFGVFALYKLARSKLYLLLALVAFGVFAASINRSLTLLTIVLPAVALITAAGLRYLYVQWRSVFPKNPLPRYLALALIVSLVAVHILYGLRYSQVAWPNSPATRSAYVLK